MAVGDFSRLTLGTGLTGTDLGDGEIQIDAAGETTVANDTIWDAKGDLVAASAADTAARLAVGSNDQVLTADSAQTLGMKWSTPSAGAAGALTLLHTLTLGSAGTFDQSSIGGSYNDLVLALILRSSDAVATDGASFRFNNDSGSNYNREGEQLSGTSAPSVFESRNTSALNAGKCPGSSGALANSFGVIEMTIFGYASTTWLKAVVWQSFTKAIDSTGNLLYHGGGGMWASTAAINRVQVLNANSFGNFVTGSQLRIYGRL